MNILVTGGAGYIGSSLVEGLNSLKCISNIYVLDNLIRSPLAFFLGTEKLSKVTFVKGDILDSYKLDNLLKKTDVVYHLAGYVLSPYSYTQNVQYEQVNRWGTLNLVRSIERSPKRIQKFIYLSSASVYGLKGKVDTNNSPQPTNAYGKSKLAGEKYVLLLKDLCQTNIVRAANVFGFNACLRLDSVLNNFIFQAITQKKILIYGNGEQKRPFIFLKRLIQDLAGLLNNTETNKQLIKHAMQFNATLNDIKDWLLKAHIPDLEYTYVNKDIDYEEQYFKHLDSLNNHLPTLDKAFEAFRKNIRIR